MGAYSRDVEDAESAAVSVAAEAREQVDGREAMKEGARASGEGAPRAQSRWAGRHPGREES